MSQASTTWNASTPRRMFAVILSALMPGVGQLMLGRRRWAVFWVVLPLVFMLFVPKLGLAAVLAQYLCRLGASAQAALMRTSGGAADPTSKTVALAALLT